MSEPQQSADDVFEFKPVELRGTHILASFIGYSGGGKTYSALMFGRGLVGPDGKLALLDTENERGRIYAKDIPGAYFYSQFLPPFTPERYVAAIRSAARAGINCLVIDSGSDEWEGIGGLIEIADAGTTKSGRALQGLQKWADPKKRHKRFMQELVQTRMHVLICLRAKEKNVQEKDDKGKDVIRMIGIVPIQDKGFKYQMTLEFFMPAYTEGNDPRTGIPLMTKVPRPLLGVFTDRTRRVSIEMGAQIAEWVKTGTAVDDSFEKLRVDGYEAAEGGMDVLEKWFKKLTRAEKLAIQPYMTDMKSTAADHDKDPGAPLDDEGFTQSASTDPGQFNYEEQKS